MKWRRELLHGRRKPTSSQATARSDFIHLRTRLRWTSKQGETAILVKMWRKGCAFWVKLRFAQWSETLRLRYFFAFGKKAKKWWGIYNQIRTHSPFCKRLISSSSHVTHKIKWRILQFLREVFQQFRWHAVALRLTFATWCILRKCGITLLAELCGSHEAVRQEMRFLVFHHQHSAEWQFHITPVSKPFFKHMKNSSLQIQIDRSSLIFLHKSCNSRKLLSCGKKALFS